MNENEIGQQKGGGGNGKEQKTKNVTEKHEVGAQKQGEQLVGNLNEDNKALFRRDV